jgi:hypothetical protein
VPYLTIVWRTADGALLYAKRNGHFPNGKAAAAWVSDAGSASLFTREEARAIRGRVELRPGDRLTFAAANEANP